MLIQPAEGRAKPLAPALTSGESAYPELWRDLAVALPILASGDPHNYAGRVACSLQNGASPSITDVGRAVSLNGQTAQRIRVPEPFPQTAPEWTWAVWFDYRSAGATNPSSVVQSEDGTGTGRTILLVRDHTGQEGALGSFITGAAIAASTPLVAGRRYLGAITKRGRDISLYLDGRLDGSGSGDVTANSGAPIYIGSPKDGATSGSLDANILAVYAWSRALSDAEMRLLGALPMAPIVRRRRVQVAVLAAPAPAGQTIQPARLESTAQVYAPTLQRAPHPIAPARLESTASVHAPTLARAPRAVQPARLASTAQVYAPRVVVAPRAVQVARLESTATVYAPGLRRAPRVVVVDLLASTTTLYAPRLRSGARGTLTFDALTLTPALSFGALDLAPALSLDALTLTPALAFDALTLEPD